MAEKKQTQKPKGAVEILGPRNRTAALVPQTSITVAIDTAFVASQGGGFITQGVYMFDNRVDNGSTGEGSTELSTVCNNQDLIGFNVVPIDILGSLGDQVTITGFNVSQGSVFTANGVPVQQPTSPYGEPVGAYWIGQALNQGSQTYQIFVDVQVGLLQPQSFSINWDPFITSQ